MSQSRINIMAMLLTECLPYLTGAKTGALLPKHLTGVGAARLQKQILDILAAHEEERSKHFSEIIEKVFTKRGES